MNQDNSQSWVRISYGTAKYVIDFIKDDTENLADPQEEESVPTSSGLAAARSKAKAKPQPREFAGTTTIPLRERRWIDIEPSKQDLDSYDLSKKVINLLRHKQKLHREEDGATFNKLNLSLSPENKVSKFCKEAGYMRVMEAGQYFVTKDTGSLRQFRSVACREYTLPRDDPASQAKGWIQGNMRIGPVLEVTTSFQHFKYGIEIRIWSVKQDNSQYWVRISYGTMKNVVDSIQNNTEILVDPHEEQLPQTSIKVVAARSKAKAKPQPRVLVGTTATIPIHERKWIDIEPSEQTLAAYWKKVMSLLRHNQTVQREKDGAIEFYRIKFYLRNHHSQIQLWSDDRWIACLEAGGGSKRRYQYCSDDSGRILYLRALQGHSGSNLIDPALHDNVVIGTEIFNYIYRIGCVFNLHSIINNGLIPGGQDSSRRQTVFFLPINPRDERFIKILNILSSLYHVERGTCTVHGKGIMIRYFWVDINLAIRER